ncbi:MAG: hypothetical protein ACYTFY_10330, partial [Planctomycetota bacterium]
MSRFSVFSALTVLILAANLFAAETKFDSGGVSIDFSKIKTPSSTVFGPNLVVNGSFEEADASGNVFEMNEWFRSWHVHPQPGKKKEAEDLKTAAANLVITTTATDNPAHGLRFARVTVPAEVNDLRSDPEKGVPMISAGFAANIPIPANNQSGQYQLSFKSRGRFANGVSGLNQLVAVINFRGGSDLLHKCKNVGKSLVKHKPLTAGWLSHSIPITVPDGTSFISFYLKLYGCGEIDFDDVELYQVQSESKVSAKIIPQGYIDNCFYMTPGDAITLCISCKNNDNIKIQDPHLNIKLPEDVKLLSARAPNTIAGKKTIKENKKGYVIYNIKLKNYKPKRDLYATWDMPAFLVETKAKPGSSFDAYYQFSEKEFRSEWNHFIVKVIEGAESTEAPKKFKSAAMFAREANYTEPSAVNAFVEFYSKTGMNSIHGRLPDPLSKKLAKNNIKRYAQPYFLCNGYRLGQKKKPENVLFMLADGTYRTSPREAICPIEVYTEGSYFKDAIIPYIREYLIDKDYCDSIMANWELHAYDYKGCFCERCKAEFIKQSKLPGGEIEKEWPQNIIVKYRSPWVKFRSWQHAKMVRVIEKTVQKVGKEAGKDSHFIPEIAWGSLTEGGRDHYLQYDPRDYLKDLPVIEPWGPYIFFDVTRPYIYNTGIHLITYEAGKSIRSYVDKHLKGSKKTSDLIAFPHGFQCNTWITEPEAISFEMLGYLLNGWNGTFLYYVPRGYDARYWNTIIDA